MITKEKIREVVVNNFIDGFTCGIKDQNDPTYEPDLVFNLTEPRPTLYISKENLNKFIDEIFALIPQKSKAKKEFVPPTIEEFIAYFKENGFSKELAERAYKGYEVADWKDSKGSPIKSWKQKCQHVWFSDRNKDYKTDDPSSGKFSFM